MEDTLISVAAILTLITGFGIGKRYGLWRGLAAGLVVFAIMVLLIVGLGYGY